MTKLLDLFDLLIGCHHKHISRPMNLDGQGTYIRCTECGAKKYVEWLDEGVKK